MLQKAVIGFLVITIIGAIVVGISDATRQSAEDNVVDTNNAEDVANTSTNRNVQNQVLLQKIDGSAMLRNLRTEFIKETIKTDGKSIQVATL